jgi:pimeloyl-ACP methyl ester carboxylesterase
MDTQYFDRPEGRLAYTDYGGSGDLVLMLPGMGALRSEYRFLAPKLHEAGFRAVTIDLRGQGESSVPWDVYDVPSVGNDILAMVDHLDGGPAHLIGTSFAPAAVAWAAVERPDLVRSLVLISPFVRTAKINPLMLALFWVMMNNPWRVRAWAGYYRTLYPTRKPDDFQDYIRQLRENLAEPGRFAAVKALGGSSRKPSEERLTRVTTPALVIMGTKDPDFPDPAVEGRLVADQTGGALQLIEGAGHYPQTEMPEQTVPIVLGFLERSASK